MDGFSALANATTLLQQSFHLFRHVSSARSFDDTTGRLSAMIAVEYFRFETWLQQSGLLTTDPSSGELVVHEHSIRRCLLLAAETQSLTMEYGRVEHHFLTVLGEAHHCLQHLQRLREKYALEEPPDDGVFNQGISSVNSMPVRTNEVPGLQPLFRNPRVTTALSNDVRNRQRRSRVVSFFRKVNFAWSLSDDVSDRDKIVSIVQSLKNCNDALRECLSPADRRTADQLVNLKALALSSTPAELRGIGYAANALHGEVYDDIYKSVMLKARRADASSQSIPVEELEGMQIDMQRIQGDKSWNADNVDSSQKFTHPRSLSTYLVDSNTTNTTITTTILLERSAFSTTLSDDDVELLKERIATLCMLLKTAGHPYFAVLPVCEGYIHHSRTSFALAYQLPPFAVPDRPPCSLYSLLPRGRHSVESEKGPSSSRGLLPSLEQRYELAAALAEGLLSLLGVDWVHKALNSRNVMLYYARPNPQSAMPAHLGGISPDARLRFASPQFLGFGVARREQPGERTIDLRDGEQSPWRFWLHPELRLAGGEHRRFERRFDIYALGLVLFEIGMWQDLHYYGASCVGAEEVRQRVVNVCAREMAHRMGEAYKSAVMACLDGDEIWKSAAMAGGVGTGDQGPTITEPFYVNVCAVLKSCCQTSS